jgi:hypothetical protein
MAIDVSFRDGYSTSAQDLSRFNKNFIINSGVANDGLKVSQSVVPAMSVLVTAGTSYFYGTGTTADTMFEFYSDSTETVTIPTAAAQARIDIVCCKVDASTGASSFVVVSGTPSGSPVVPVTPASHYKLAEVAVGASVTTITNANITDTRRSVFVAPTGARNQGLINGYIRATVASNNLTVAISTSPTSLVAPTATNPVGIWIGNNLRWITSSLSIAANAGTNWFNSGGAELATREIDYFVYAGYNATDGITLGYARIPYAKLYSDFNTTTTNEKYARISTITNAAAGDNYVNIGRFAATLSATASFNWSVPTFDNANLIQEPVYETRWLLATLAPQGDGGSLGAFAQDTISHRYKIRYDNCFVQATARVTNKGSWTGAVRMRLPMSCKSASFSDLYMQSGWTPNNGNPVTATRGGAKIDSSIYANWVSNIFNANLAWSAVVNSDSYWFNGEYEI